MSSSSATVRVTASQASVSCPVCLEAVPAAEQLFLEPCFHIICVKCIHNILTVASGASDCEAGSVACPVCRTPVNSAVSSTLGRHQHIPLTLGEVLKLQQLSSAAAVASQRLQCYALPERDLARVCSRVMNANAAEVGRACSDCADDRVLRPMSSDVEQWLQRELGILMQTECTGLQYQVVTHILRTHLPARRSRLAPADVRSMHSKLHDAVLKYLAGNTAAFLCQLRCFLGTKLSLSGWDERMSKELHATTSSSRLLTDQTAVLDSDAAPASAPGPDLADTPALLPTLQASDAQPQPSQVALRAEPESSEASMQLRPDRSGVPVPSDSRGASDPQPPTSACQQSSDAPVGHALSLAETSSKGTCHSIMFDCVPACACRSWCRAAPAVGSGLGAGSAHVVACTALREQVTACTCATTLLQNGQRARQGGGSVGCVTRTAGEDKAAWSSPGCARAACERAPVLCKRTRGSPAAAVEASVRTQRRKICAGWKVERATSEARRQCDRECAESLIHGQGEGSKTEEFHPNHAVLHSSVELSSDCETPPAYG